MDILVVGGGGREHAIIRKLKESPRCGRLYCAPGNGGIAEDAECCDVAATDIPGMVALAKRLEVDLVFVAPDDPLVAGMADAMEKAGIAAFGPFANAAILEGSKVFSKKLMKKYGIPTAGYEVFDKPEEALEYIRRQDRYPAVIKADGLALGKGVVLCTDYQEACKAVAGDHGGSGVRRIRQSGGGGGVPHRAGGIRAGLYRRPHRKADGVRQGS